MITHVLRYDDFSECSSTVVEEGLVQHLLKHRIPCTFGVVPYACDPETLLKRGQVSLKSLSSAKAQLLQPLIKEGLGEIALHGYSHLTLAPVRGHQEFSQRMPVATQRELIRRGRGHLENLFKTRVTLYIPPWNHLATATAEVLAEQGMFLSGDILGGEPAQVLSLLQFPCSAGIRETTNVLHLASRFSGDHGAGTVFHDYDFKESGLGVGDLTFQEFESLLSEWGSLTGIQRKLISRAIADTGNDDTSVRANTGFRFRYRNSRIGRRLLPLADKIYWSPDTALRLTNLIHFLP